MLPEQFVSVAFGIAVATFLALEGALVYLIQTVHS